MNEIDAEPSNAIVGLQGLIVLSPDLYEVSEEYAGQTGREIVFIKDEQALKSLVREWPVLYESVTLIVEQDDLDNAVLEILFSAGVPFSIITLDNKDNIIRYLNRIKKIRYLDFEEIYIHDFISGNKNKRMLEMDTVKSSSACLLSGHGDYLCFNMESGILCSKMEKGNIASGKALPKCILEETCFRLERLNNPEAEIISVRDLPAKFIFMNTCSGISFKDRKYKDYEKSLYSEAVNHQCLVFISNYIIGYYTVQELNMYYVLLIHFENFALSLFYYNLMVKQFLRKKPSAIMIGDSRMNLRPKGKTPNGRGKVQLIYGDKDYSILSVQGEFVKNSLVFELDQSLFKNNLLETVTIDRDKNCDYTLGIYLKDTYTFLLYSEKESIDTTIILYKETSLEKEIKVTLNELLKSRYWLDFLLQEEDRKKNLELIDYFEKQLTEHGIIQTNLKLNVEKYTYLYHILKKCKWFLTGLGKEFVKASLTYASHTDSLLLLQTKGMQSKYLLDETICPICGSKAVKMLFQTTGQNRFYYKKICPACEIYSISTLEEDNLNLKFTVLHNKAIHLKYDLKADWKDLYLGIALIQTTVTAFYSIGSTKELNASDYVLDIRELKGRGLYYIRTVLKSKEHLTILHRQVFL